MQATKCSLTGTGVLSAVACTLWMALGSAWADAGAVPKPPKYRIDNLGRPEGGGYSFAYGVNSQGMVTGQVRMGRLGFGTFLYQDGRFRVMDTLAPRGFQDEGYAINESGVVAGSSFARPVLYRDNRPVSLLGPGTPGQTGGVALDVNDAGMATGYAYGSASDDTAFIYDGTRTSLLRIEGVERSWGVAINATGDVLMRTWANERDGAYFYRQGRFTALLAPAADTRVDPVGLNDAGQIAVTLWTPAGPQAAIYSDGHYQTLTEASDRLYAMAINNRGSMLLREALPGGDAGDTFLYQDGTVYNLENLLFPFGAAKWDNKLSFGLSDAGHIVGLGTYNGRVQRSFLATPVPEPDTVVLMLAGLCAVGGAARRITGRLR